MGWRLRLYVTGWMCTVTYIPAKNKIFLTSSRDENFWRLPAVAPQEYDFPSGKLYYPKDTNAGGTWMAVHENGHVIVLLNGGFKWHEAKPPYRKSRGLVLLDLLQHESPFDFFRSISLQDIEPFTLVIWQQEALYECRWDGDKKHARLLDKTRPQIWSSATLYTEEITAKRTRWFDEWLAEKTDFSQNDILDFHQCTGDGDAHNDLAMNRNGKVFTVSITGMEISDGKAQITYLDLLENKMHRLDVELNNELAGRL